MTLFQNKYRVESARLRHWDYRTRAWYFVTICTHKRAHILSEIISGEVQLSRIGRVAELDLKDLGNHYENVQVASYVVMPNHLHAIVMIDGDHCYSPNPNQLPLSKGISPAAGSLSTIIRGYKAGGPDDVTSWA